MSKVFVVVIKDYCDVCDSLSPHSEVLCVTATMAEGKTRAEKKLHKCGISNVIWHESFALERACSEMPNSMFVAAEVQAYSVEGAAKQQKG